MSDVNLVVGGRRFHAHSDVLAANSEQFAEILARDPLTTAVDRAVAPLKRLQEASRATGSASLVVAMHYIVLVWSALVTLIIAGKMWALPNRSRTIVVKDVSYEARPETPATPPPPMGYHCRHAGGTPGSPCVSASEGAMLRTAHSSRASHIDAAAAPRGPHRASGPRPGARAKRERRAMRRTRAMRGTQVMLIMMHFMYAAPGQAAAIPEGRREDAFAAAERYGVASLRGEALRSMMANVTMETVCVSHLHSNP